VERLAARHYPHDVFGWSNTLTLLRGALACVLITPLVAGIPNGWAMVAIATVAFSLDGADGWVARRYGFVTSFGGRFDIEVDAALALILAAHALSDGLAALVLILGLAYYLFIAATWIFPWLARPLPARFSRKAVCVLQLGTLIVLQVPLLTANSALALAVIASLVLLASFAVDIAWLWGHRR
jgi:phosphatidylglycerophosphate synthase